MIRGPEFSLLSLVSLPPRRFPVPVAFLADAGSDEKNTFVPPPPRSVEVVFPVVGPVTVYLGMPGQTVFYTRTEVRARVKGFLEAAIEATKLRFRTVMMTALSFILGVIPLLIATGAGSESQKVIGTAVFGGMIAATFLSLAVVPMLYYVVEMVKERVRK